MINPSSSSVHDGPLEEVDYVDTKSDLIPGLYEGGLKTWEGGLDLVEVLNSVENLAEWVGGIQILEVRMSNIVKKAYGKIGWLRYCAPNGVYSQLSTLCPSNIDSPSTENDSSCSGL